MKNVIIIDALNMFLRSFVVSPHMDKGGNPVGGTIGFLKSLQKVARDFDADELIYEQGLQSRTQTCEV
jgi:5'-3' exonuclease